MTGLLDRAIARMRVLSPEMQDEATRMLLLFAREGNSPVQLTPEEEVDLAEADRDKFATEEARAVFARYGA